MLLLLLFAGMAAAASQYPSGARLMPAAIGLAGTALCLLQIALDLGGLQRSRAIHLAPKLGRPEGHDEGATGLGPQTRRREFAIWGYFLAFIGGLLALGFYAAVPAMFFLFLWRQAGVRPLAAAASAAAAGATMSLIFGELFGFALFPGLVWPAILPSISGG
jgi:hypothetical protein